MTHYQFSQIFLGFAAKDRYTVAESLLYHLYPPNNPPFPKTKDPRVRNSGIYFTVICRSSV